MLPIDLPTRLPHGHMFLFVGWSLQRGQGSTNQVDADIGSYHPYKNFDVTTLIERAPHGSRREQESFSTDVLPF